jgi:hypothetical protein
MAITKSISITRSSSSTGAPAFPWGAAPPQHTGSHAALAVLNRLIKKLKKALRSDRIASHIMADYSGKCLDQLDLIFRVKGHGEPPELK